MYSEPVINLHNGLQHTEKSHGLNSTLLRERRKVNLLSSHLREILKTSPEHEHT